MVEVPVPEQAPQPLPVPSLSAEQLVNFEGTVVPSYTVGEPITRNNLTAALLSSFMMSRGRLEVQQAYFEWLNRHNILDYKTTIEAMAQAGGVAVFNDAEQQQLYDAFNRVPHNNARDSMTEAQKREDIVNEIYKQLESMKDGGYHGKPFYNGAEWAPQIDPQQLATIPAEELQHFLSIWLKEHPQPRHPWQWRKEGKRPEENNDWQDEY